VLAFAPPDLAQEDPVVGLEGEPAPRGVDVFLFFHGRAGDYSANKKADAKDKTDNPALAADMKNAAAQSHVIAICPQGKTLNVENEWATMDAASYQDLVRTTLARLGPDLGLKRPLQPRAVSVAGHSAGGAAIGGAAAATDATDVTLQEAGYGGGAWNRSWDK